MEMGGYDWGSDYISSIGDDATQWDTDQADSMFLANMFAQSGSDKLLDHRGVGGGVKGADKQAYYQFHHTDLI